jgi:hypothetical protein
MPEAAVASVVALNADNDRLNYKIIRRQGFSNLLIGNDDKCARRSDGVGSEADGRSSNSAGGSSSSVRVDSCLVGDCSGSVEGGSISVRVGLSSDGGSSDSVRVCSYSVRKMIFPTGFAFWFRQFIPTCGSFCRAFVTCSIAPFFIFNGLHGGTRQAKGLQACAS